MIATVQTRVSISISLHEIVLRISSLRGLFWPGPGLVAAVGVQQETGRRASVWIVETRVHRRR